MLRYYVKSVKNYIGYNKTAKIERADIKAQIQHDRIH